MADIDLARQVRQHLDSLKASGVEWLPMGAPLVREVGAAISQAAGGSLFEPAPVAPVASSQTPDQRRFELKLLAEQVSTCTRCPELVSTRRQTVFGVGPMDPELLFIGEAPGADEDRQGEPFVGAAGQLLNRIIAACGFQREEVYICNVIKCRPPGNRTPKPEEAANCREYLDRQLEMVRPKFICCLGGTAGYISLACRRSPGCVADSTITRASPSCVLTIPRSCCRIASRRRKRTSGKTCRCC